MILCMRRCVDLHSLSLLTWMRTLADNEILLVGQAQQAKQA
jgi:hypothetical protein